MEWRRPRRRVSIFDCWDWKHEQSDVSRQVERWTRNAPKFVLCVKRCLSMNFPVCCACQKLVIKAHPYDIFSEEAGRHDDVPVVGAPSDNSNLGEWWPDEVDLDTVTIGNMSIDSKPVETNGKRGRHREITIDCGAGEPVVNPIEWPNVDLKPSKGSVKEQRHVCLGGKKNDKLRELTVKVRTEGHGGEATFQAE